MQEIIDALVRATSSEFEADYSRNDYRRLCEAALRALEGSGVSAREENLRAAAEDAASRLDEWCADAEGKLGSGTVYVARNVLRDGLAGTYEE